MRAFRTYGLLAVNLLLTQFLAISAAFGQPPNNSCAGAINLCPGIAVSSSNEGATVTVCPACEDDFNFCFSPRNSVWFTFTTNETGGDVTVTVSNPVYVVGANRGNRLQGVVVKAAVQCNASTFTLVSNCEAGSAGTFSLLATGLDPETTYYVAISGENGTGANPLPAEAAFDITASGPGIDRNTPGIFIAGPGTQLCPNQVVTFTAGILNCPDSTNFIWKVNGETAAVTGGQNWLTSAIEDGSLITVETTCYAGCPVAVNAQYGPIAVENLVVDAGADQFLEEGQTTKLDGSTNGISWTWSPANSLSDPGILDPIAYPENTTSYFLTASSANCTLTDEVVIKIAGKFVIPGSFSPNDDGVNDTWIITGIDDYPNANVVLYDRWGQLIEDIVGYSSQKSWDGTRSGNKVTDGVYFYHINLRDGKSEPLTGYVTVLR